MGSQARDGKRKMQRRCWGRGMFSFRLNCVIFLVCIFVFSSASALAECINCDVAKLRWDEVYNRETLPKINLNPSCISVDQAILLNIIQASKAGSRSTLENNIGLC